MKKHLPLALPLAALLAFGAGGPAVANDHPTPSEGQTLADYIGDGNDAQWDKVQTWIEAEYGDGATIPAPEPEPSPEPEPTPTPEPTTDPTPALTDATVVATDDNRITLEGKLTGTTDEVTFRASAYEFGTQAGYPVQGTPDAEGNISLEVEDFNNTDPRYWQVELGGSTWTHGEVIASGEITPAPEPTQEPAPEPTPDAEPVSDTTDGSGGEYTDRLKQSFTSAGLTSEYHIFAEGIDPSKPVGVIFYADGSGGYGYNNPGQDYLIGGSTGLAAVAAKHNMILVTPLAPAPGCPSSNCWYDQNLGTAQAKAQWAADLLETVKGQYPIDQDRIVIGGYSSGAQLTTQTLLPAHGEDLSVDLAVAIAYGGAPRSDMQASQAWKDDLVISWDTGTADVAYGTESYKAVGGYNDYTAEGFNTDYVWPAGKGHSRGQEFGGILDREITQHLQ